MNAKSYGKPPDPKDEVKTDEQPLPQPKRNGHRLSFNDLNKSSQLAIWDKVIEKLTGRQLFWLIIVLVAAYTVLNWEN
jgi:hypothetical protein